MILFLRCPRETRISRISRSSLQTFWFPHVTPEATIRSQRKSRRDFEKCSNLTGVFSNERELFIDARTVETEMFRAVTNVSREFELEVGVYEVVEFFRW